MGGYDDALAIIEFVAEKDGWDQVIELVRNPEAFEIIFGIPKETFEKNGVASLIATYGSACF